VAPERVGDTLRELDVVLTDDELAGVLTRTVR
jgi:hypothetical protein